MIMTDFDIEDIVLEEKRVRIFIINQYYHYYFVYIITLGFIF